MRAAEAQGLDGQDDSLWNRKTADWLAHVSYRRVATVSVHRLSHLFLSLVFFLRPLHSLHAPLPSFSLFHSHSYCTSLQFFKKKILISFTLLHFSCPSLLYHGNALFSLDASLFLASCLHPSQRPCVTLGRVITRGWNISSVAPYSAFSTRIIRLWSIPFCGEPSSYSPVMIGVLVTLCICTVI